MVESTESSGAIVGSPGAVGAVRWTLSTAWTIVRWIALLALSVLWLVFWANLARHHLFQGDVLAAAVSVVPVVIPPVFLILVFRER